MTAELHAPSRKLWNHIASARPVTKIRCQLPSNCLCPHLFPAKNWFPICWICLFPLRGANRISHCMTAEDSACEMGSKLMTTYPAQTQITTGMLVVLVVSIVVMSTASQRCEYLSIDLFNAQLFSVRLAVQASKKAFAWLDSHGGAKSVFLDCSFQVPLACINCCCNYNFLLEVTTVACSSARERVS